MNHSFYLAELGLQGSYRGAGLGKELTRARLELIDKSRYTHVVVRTSAMRNASYEMYMSMGFDDMGVYMEVASRRLHGHVTTDRRLFLSKVLTSRDGASDEVVDDPLTQGTGAVSEH